MFSVISGHGFIYEVQTISQIFFPNEKFLMIESPAEKGVTVRSVHSGGFVLSAVYENGVLIADDKRKAGADIKKSVCSGLYLLLVKITGYENPWGMLTGVKPTKLIGELLDKNISEDEIVKKINREYYSDEKKIRFCAEVSKNCREAANNGGEDATYLYVGVPFCVSRCLYCSFTSYDIKKYRAEDYLRALKKEMRAARSFFDGKKIAVYMGGGTPTALDEKNFAALLQTVIENFGANGFYEFTVEAGRPDTITREKLREMKNNNVTRISINPQTMNDSTLINIGRGHSAKDIINCFGLARGEGFTNINADLIMGLPGESAEHAMITMRAIEELVPEGVTVHTLAVKRASRLKEELAVHDFKSGAEIEKMLAVARESCEKAGMRPYYMYRQKNSPGNLENTGYARRGSECVYNAAIIEEKRTIMSLGAGAVTKIVYNSENRIERLFNVKEPGEYIKKIDEMIERKRVLTEVL